MLARVDWALRGLGPSAEEREMCEFNCTPVSAKWATGRHRHRPAAQETEAWVRGNDLVMWSAWGQPRSRWGNTGPGPESHESSRRAPEKGEWGVCELITRVLLLSPL